ncbi:MULTISPECIES: hypothetical protein [unclassified Pseudonocardia]|nr:MULTISPECIES: hypothetical protein [unclassified Pseudonocardia]
MTGSVPRATAFHARVPGTAPLTADVAHLAALLGSQQYPSTS